MQPHYSKSRQLAVRAYNRQRHLQNLSYALILQRQRLQDMMQTGEEFSAQWDIPEHSSILKKLTCSLRVKPEKSRSFKMVRL